MKWTSLFLAQLRHSLRTPWAFFFVVLAVVISLAAGLRLETQTGNRFLVAVINEDEGTYGARLIEGLADYNEIELLPMEKSDALDLLRQDQLEAVFIIRSNYTEKLRHDEYRDLIDWYTAPSSRAAATISEPLINVTLRLWVEEQAISNTRSYLSGRGLAYTAADEQAQRDMIMQVWENKTLILIETSMTAGSDLSRPGTAGWLDRNDPLAACVRWYAVFCVFYLVVSASWILDISKRGLRIRVTQSGARFWKLLLGTSLAPLLIGLAGFWLTGSLCCLLAGGSWGKMFMLTLPMVIYLWTILGITITLASFIRQSLALLFLAPLVTFVNAILGGLITDLPDWAALLVRLSRALPGRWLLQFFDQPLPTLPIALLCSLCWFLAGIFFSEIRSYTSFARKFRPRSSPS
jgi:hypothetical protein